MVCGMIKAWAVGKNTCTRIYFIKIFLFYPISNGSRGSLQVTQQSKTMDTLKWFKTIWNHIQCNTCLWLNQAMIPRAQNPCWRSIFQLEVEMMLIRSRWAFRDSTFYMGHNPSTTGPTLGPLRLPDAKNWVILVAAFTLWNSLHRIAWCCFRKLSQTCYFIWVQLCFHVFLDIRFSGFETYY